MRLTKLSSRMVDEAKARHYQDQPYLTSGLIGGGIGAAIPLLRAAYNGNTDGLATDTALSGTLGVGAGMGAEAIGRLLTRTVGPEFNNRRFRRDQDPHRVNTGLKMGPVLALALARMVTPIHTAKQANAERALQLGLVGAGAGGLTQLARRAFQSREDKQKHGAPSILNGVLLGGLGGAAVGGMLPAGQPTPSATTQAPLTDAQLNEVLGGSLSLAEAQHTYRTHVAHGKNFASSIRELGNGNDFGAKGGTVMVNGVWQASDAVPTPVPLHGYNYTMAPFTRGQDPSGSAILAHSPKGPAYLSMLNDLKGGLIGLTANPTWEVKSENTAALLELLRRGNVSAEELARFSPDKMPGNGLINNFQRATAQPPMVKTNTASESDDKRLAAAEAKTGVPKDDKQKHDGDYPMGVFTWKGLSITIETAKGQTRSGKDKNGKAWSIELKNSYGFINRTESAEPGDEMDVFIGPDLDSEVVFIVDQNKNDKPEWDEHKTIIGTVNAAQAKQIYLDNYSPGWKGFRSITALTLDQFRKWLKKGDVTQPLAGQAMDTFCKQATIDWKALGAEVQRQLPGLHGFEAGLGAVAGAGAGLGYHKLRQWYGQKYRNPDHAKLDMIKRVLTGAAVGGVGSNLVADRTRRWLSNIPNPVGYDAAAQMADLRQAGWGGFVEGAIKDNPIFLTKEKGLDHSIVRHLRRETLRRGLGVHTPNPAQDYLKVLGSAPDGAPVLGMADRFFDAQHRLRPDKDAQDLWDQFKPHQLNVAQSSDNGKFVPASSPFFGNFSTRRFGDDLQLYDRWDFDLHDDEKSKLSDGLKEWKDKILQQRNPAHWSPSFLLGADKANRIKTLAARKLVDMTVARKMPFFFQSFNIPQPPEPDLAGLESSDTPTPPKEQPYRVPLFGEGS